MKNIYVMRGAHKDMRGFEYLVYSAVSLSLLVVLIALPVAPVFASEETVEDSGGSPEELVEESQESETETPENDEVNIEDEDVVDENQVTLPEVGEADEASGTLTTTSTGTSSIEENSNDTDEATSTDAVVDIGVSTSTDLENEEVVTVPEEGDVQDTDEVLSKSDETKNDNKGHSEIENSPEFTESTFVHEVTNNENRFSFAKNECTLVGDGSFYCAKSKDVVEVTHTDRVFSAPDTDGDMEIYIEKGGKIFQITDNTYDDDAPRYDELSNSIVWHRLIQGRYQIISYDITTGIETQVTFDRYNNMHPNRFDDTTVWQGWVGDDWEIFMLKGDELSMLTDNNVHDIAPHINGTHIIWQSFQDNAWVMKVYDLRTQRIETVHATDGGSIENPRFVLVYDTKYESGDIHTRGYDLASGEIVELGVEPVKVPEKLPDSEQTGEERALVSPSVSPKTKSQASDEDIDDDEKDIEDLDVSDIVIPAFTEVSVPTITEDDVQQDDSFIHTDLPVLDMSSLTEVVADEDESEINDLIITPFVEPIDTGEKSSTDSQSAVATST